MAIDKCNKCERYAKCRIMIDEAKSRNSPLLALEALKLCPVWQHEELHRKARQLKKLIEALKGNAKCDQ